MTSSTQAALIHKKHGKKLKLNKFKLCIWITFNNTYLITSQLNPLRVL